MIRLKPASVQSAPTTKAITPKPDKSVIRPSSRSGVPPPVDYQWKPGQSGNPTGRPKVIKSAYERKMMEPVMIEENVLDEKTKRIKKVKRVGTRAEQIAGRLVTEAAAKFRSGFASAQVSAAQELRKVIEPTEEEGQSSPMGDASIGRSIVEILLSRRLSEKPANAIEI